MPKQTSKSLEECQEFARVWQNAVDKRLLTQDVANHFGMSLRHANTVRRQVERALGIVLPPITHPGTTGLPRFEHLKIQKKKLSAIIVSDWHIWPGPRSFAEDVFLKTLENHKFDYVILNGDVTDQPAMSSHGRLPGEEPLSLADELEEAKTRVAAVEERSGKAKRIWCWGNHDERLDKNILRQSPNLADVSGLSLEDQFPKWAFVMSLDINDVVVVKHFWHGSMHAAHANVLKSGKSMVTGHTHKLLVRPYADYSGVRYGIECGTLADPMGPQFRYVDNNPRDWHPGFVILDVEKHKDGTIDVRPQTVDCALKTPHVYGRPWNK